MLLLGGGVSARAKAPDPMRKAEEELTHAYCEYQLAFVLLTYEIEEDDLARAITNARIKVGAFQAAYARARTAGVPASFLLACDTRRGYAEYRGGIAKWAFIRYNRYRDPPFKLLRFGQLHVQNPGRWLAGYRRQRHGPAQKLYLHRYEDQGWRELARARLGWAVAHFEAQRKGVDSTHGDQTLRHYWEMRFLLHFARAARVGEQETLGSGPPAAGGKFRPTLAQVKQQLPTWERQMEELRGKLEAHDLHRWRGYLARLTGDKLAIFRAHCLRRLECRISDGSGMLDRVGQASIWVFEDRAYGDAYTGFYKAYHFREDVVIDELTTVDSPVPPSASWAALRRAARRLAPRRPILTPAE
jgi:hypothetical protein